MMKQRCRSGVDDDGNDGNGGNSGNDSNGDVDGDDSAAAADGDDVDDDDSGVSRTAIGRPSETQLLSMVTIGFQRFVAKAIATV